MIVGGERRALTCSVGVGGGIWRGQSISEVAGGRRSAGVIRERREAAGRGLEWEKRSLAGMRWGGCLGITMTAEGGV